MGRPVTVNARPSRFWAVTGEICRSRAIWSARNSASGCGALQRRDLLELGVSQKQRTRVEHVSHVA